MGAANGPEAQQGVPPSHSLALSRPGKPHLEQVLEHVRVRPAAHASRPPFVSLQEEGQDALLERVRLLVRLEMEGGAGVRAVVGERAQGLAGRQTGIEG